jgi:hypothetical protein
MASAGKRNSSLTLTTSVPMRGFFRSEFGDYSLAGVAGMLSTARVQRGPSEAARCASKESVPVAPAS